MHRQIGFIVADQGAVYHIYYGAAMWCIPASSLHETNRKKTHALIQLMDNTIVNYNILNGRVSDFICLNFSCFSFVFITLLTFDCRLIE